MRCRLCNSVRLVSVVDLGASPPYERFLCADELDAAELTYPLHLRLCTECLLLQIPALITKHASTLVDDVARIRGRGSASLVVANDLYAQIHDLLGFTRVLRDLLPDHGWVSIEVPHALNLVAHGQFDSICHENVQYYTVLSASRALATAGLGIVDVEMLPISGGSIRIWARPEEYAGPPSGRVVEVLGLEAAAGLHGTEGYPQLRSRAQALRHALLRFLLDCHAEGKRVVGYGARNKSNTLLNYCGIRSDLLSYIVDPHPDTHGRFTPGTRIPIYEPAQIVKDRPDVVLALPWNLEGQLTAYLAYIAAWGGELVFPLPTLHRATLTLETNSR